MKLPQYPQTNQILQIKVKESRPHTLFFRQRTSEDCYKIICYDDYVNSKSSEKADLDFL